MIFLNYGFDVVNFNAIYTFESERNWTYIEWNERELFGVKFELRVFWMELQLGRLDKKMEVIVSSGHLEESKNLQTISIENLGWWVELW